MNSIAFLGNVQKYNQWFNTEVLEPMLKDPLLQANADALELVRDAIEIWHYKGDDEKIIDTSHADLVLLIKDVIKSAHILHDQMLLRGDEFFIAFTACVINLGTIRENFMEKLTGNQNQQNAIVGRIKNFMNDFTSPPNFEQNI